LDNGSSGSGGGVGVAARARTSAQLASALIAAVALCDARHVAAKAGKLPSRSAKRLVSAASVGKATGCDDAHAHSVGPQRGANGTTTSAAMHQAMYQHQGPPSSSYPPNMHSAHTQWGGLQTHTAQHQQSSPPRATTATASDHSAGACAASLRSEDLVPLGRLAMEREVLAGAAGGAAALAKVMTDAQSHVASRRVCRRHRSSHPSHTSCLPQRRVPPPWRRMRFRPCCASARQRQLRTRCDRGCGKGEVSDVTQVLCCAARGGSWTMAAAVVVGVLE